MTRLILLKNSIQITGILLTLCFGLAGMAQCDFSPSDKVLKLLEKAANKKKYNSEKRLEFLENALEEDENCWPCMHKIGVTEFKHAKRTGTSFGSATHWLEKIIENCPEYHSDPYYYLGAMYYADRDYEKALKYFKQFLHFPNDDASKFNKDYEKKYIEVEEVIPDVEFWQDFYDLGISFEPELVEGVSSISDDYLPAISPDGEIMFYTRVSQRKAKGDLYSKRVEEFTWSSRDDINSTFDSGKPLPPPFNLGTNYGGATVSVDNKEMYIAAKNPVAGNPNNIDIFKTTYEWIFDERENRYIYQWSELTSIGDHINTDMGFEAQPSLSGDGKRLFFVKVGAQTLPDKNGNPSHDIFMCERQDDESWGDPIPLDKINTSGQEKSPFIHSDSNTFYFSSDGLKGAGGMDLFYCKINDQGVLSEAKNIGHPINTIEDETGLIVSADGEVAYFYSKRIKGSRGYDIYSFQMPEKAKPESVMLLKGSVEDEEGNPLTDARIKLTYVQSKEVKEIDVDASDGRYATIVNLERGEDVLLSVEHENIVFNARLVSDKEAEKKPAVTKIEVTTHTLSTNKAFVINDIYYSTNSADINRSSKLILSQFAQYLLEHPLLNIEIWGHTDDIGSESNNLALSMDRAFEVKGFLEKQGVPGKRISARGFGEKQPLADNKTMEGRSQNRRTEFVINSM